MFVHLLSFAIIVNIAESTLKSLSMDFLQFSAKTFCADIKTEDDDSH